MTLKHTDAFLKQQITKIVEKRPVFQWNDGEKVHNNYPNLIQFNKALEKYVTESHNEIFALLGEREKEVNSRLTDIEPEWLAQTDGDVHEFLNQQDDRGDIYHAGKLEGEIKTLKEILGEREE